MNTFRCTNVARGRNAQFEPLRPRLPRPPVRLKPRRTKMPPPANDNEPSFGRRLTRYLLRGATAVMVVGLILWGLASGVVFS